MGDFNSHHPTWDDSTVNKGGKIISDFIFEEDLVVMNDGVATLVQNPENNSSAVDLTIVSSCLVSCAHWSVVQDCGNSNHFPTCLEINNHTIPFLFNDVFAEVYYQRNFPKTDLSLF